MNSLSMTQYLPLLLLLLVPVWIFIWAAIARAILELTVRSDGWWGFPLYMALMLPWILGGIGVLMGLIIWPFTFFS